MNKYFAIYHGLHERAPWGIAVERPHGSPRVELLMLCRTEQEAKQHAEQSSLGEATKEFRDKKISEQAAKGAK